MPAKGKHRRLKSRRLTRTFAVAGTGSAALALPLMSAAHSHAAAPQVAAAHSEQTGTPRTAKAAAPTTYTVKPGDTLSKIAQDQHVPGGWKQLYRVNHRVIGSDPDLIRPGQKLVLKGRAAGTGSSGSKKAETRAQTGSGYTMPVKGATVGTPYGQAGSMWSSGHHTGQDFVVPTGTAVHAVAEGTVVTAGWGGAYGNQVVIRHADGKYTQYAHLSSLKVSSGQSVRSGQDIGLSGATGNVTGPHLHFEVRTGPEYGSDIDPMSYLRAHGAR